MASCRLTNPLVFVLRTFIVYLFFGMLVAHTEEAEALLARLRASTATSRPAQGAAAVAPGSTPGSGSGGLQLLRFFQTAMGPWLEQRIKELAHLSMDQWPDHLHAALDHGATWRPTDSTPFGALRISASAMDSHWCLVKLEMSIPGGHDTQTYLFRRTEDVWNLVWQDEWDLEQDLARGRWGLDCRTMKIQDGKELLIAFFHLSPWCEPTTTPSTWRSGVLRIYRIPADGRASKLHESRHEVWIGGGSMPSLGRIGHQNFTLKIQVESMDVTRHNRCRMWLFPYRDGKVYKGIPLPQSPEDCVEEWAVLPWKDARRLQVQGDIPGAEILHGRELAENCSEIISLPGSHSELGVPVYATWNPRQKSWTVKVMSGGRKTIFQVVNTFKGFRIFKCL